MADETIQDVLATLVNMINNSRKKEDRNQMPMINVPVPKALILKSGNIKENFDKFKQAWNDFMIASGFNCRSELEKKALLRSVIGEDGLELYNSLELDENLETEDILVQMREKATPTVSLVYNRYFFHTATQESDSFDEYLLKLRKLLKNSDYNSSVATLEEHILRDRLIVGIRDEQVGLKFTKKRYGHITRRNKWLQYGRRIKQQTENVYKV